MKILIDINHPAHVHYFRNFIKIMEEKGHTFIVINRNEKIINELLDSYHIQHIIRNSRNENQNAITSLFYLFNTVFKVIKVAYKKKIDLFLGFASIACAITSFLYRKPSILIDDTEHNKINHLLYLPFCSAVLTPFYFKKNMGNKQIYINAFVEQLYLHSKFFRGEFSNLKNELKKPYVLIRFISYSASHDRGVEGMLTLEEKKEIVRRLLNRYSVYVIAENNECESIFNNYKLKIKPEEIHTIINNAELLISEGATMAAEAGLLGVPYIYINPLQELGNIKEQCKILKDIAHRSVNPVEIDLIISKILRSNIKKENNKYILKKLEQNTINITAFLVWFVENYPKSAKIMKENPEYQERFK